MKNSFFMLMALLALLSCSKGRAFFEESEFYMRENARMASSRPNLILFNKGYYTLKICVKDTVIAEAKVQWFCDCNDRGQLGAVDSVSIAFIDELRAVMFRSKGDDLELNLNSPGKLTRLGIYKWDETGSGVTIRFRSPVTKENKTEFTDMHFHVRPEGLVFQEMTYLNKHSSIISLVSRPKGKADPLFRGLDENANNARSTITSREFAFQKMQYVYEPKPLKLKVEGGTVIDIKTAPDAGRLTRITRYKKDDQPELKLTEILSDSIKIVTW